jgi:putative nucleotidyltransferase with HDIG domain
MDKLREITDKVARMPALSPNAARLIELMGNGDRSSRDLLSLVKGDALLTGHILNVANSAAYSRGAPVASIARALSVLGEKMVLGIALGASAPGVFAGPLTGYEGERGDLWRHGLAVAVASRVIAKYARAKVDGEVAYTAGLLHDIGKAILSEFLKGTAPSFVATIDSRRAGSYLEAERGELGVDHCEAGKSLAKRWNLPAPLAGAISCHHSPSTAPPGLGPLVYVVHAADIIAMMSGTGTGADAMLYRLDGHWEEYIDLSPRTLEEIAFAVILEHERIEAILAS